MHVKLVHVPVIILLGNQKNTLVFQPSIAIVSVNETCMHGTGYFWTKNQCAIGTDTGGFTPVP